jgi:MOSC domain-containing protein YiiM
VSTTLTVDGYDFTAHDARATISSLGAWWAQLAKDRACPPSFGALRAQQAELLARALAETANTSADIDGDTVAIERLGRLAFDAVGRGDLDPTVVLGPSLRLIVQAGDERRAAGALPATATGAVTQISVSGGGVPKRPVSTASIDRGGVAGDRQATRQHHGRPWQAVCLWSTEVIDAFAADGHPITYGACGENITVTGLPWAEVRAGVRMAVGSALLEASLFSLPCASNARWFSDRDFSRMHHERGPVSRIYATVVEAGEVQAGDPVVLEP